MEYWELIHKHRSFWWGIFLVLITAFDDIITCNNNWVLPNQFILQSYCYIIVLLALLVPRTKYGNTDFVEPSSASSQFRCLKSVPEWNIATFNVRCAQWNPHHKMLLPYYQKVLLEDSELWIKGVYRRAFNWAHIICTWIISIVTSTLPFQTLNSREHFPLHWYILLISWKSQD